MDEEEIIRNAEALIEKAKAISKEKIIAFIREQYNEDASLWQDLWTPPMVPMYEYEKIFPAQLETIDEDTLLRTIDVTIEKELGDEPMAVIPHQYIVSALPQEAGNEYSANIAAGNYRPAYDATIVYDDATLIDMYDEHIQAGTKAGYTKEQIDAIYLKQVSEFFIHERLHINTRESIITLPSSENGDSVKNYEEQEDEAEQTRDRMIRIASEYRPDSEIILEIMADIISEHQTGRTIADDLKVYLESRAKTLKKYNITSYYNGKDDSLTTAMFALFPEKIVKWIMIDGCDTKLPNVFISCCDEVLGKGIRVRGPELYNEVARYFNTKYASTLSTAEKREKIKHLELVGVTGLEQAVKPINKQQLQEVAISEQALENIETCGNIIQQEYKEIDKKTKKDECIG